METRYLKLVYRMKIRLHSVLIFLVRAKGRRDCMGLFAKGLEPRALWTAADKR